MVARWTASIVLIHLNLLLDLLEEPLARVLAQVELVAEFIHDLCWVVVLEDLDLFDMLAVELDLQNADRLLDDREEAGKRALEGPG